MSVTYRTGFEVNNAELSALHDRAFDGEPGHVEPWSVRLAAHSVAWVGAFDGERLVGFVHACWDGGKHAFLLDTAVEPTMQHAGIGVGLVRTLVLEVARAGCEWLHVDYEPHLRTFYQDACGFSSTEAGLMHLGAERIENA